MNQQDKVNQLKTQLQTFLNQLDQLEPEETSVEDIDRLLKIIEDMENKLR
ncbi:hypothetical protein SAMN05421734_10434 [Pelagirhabdus alkalitolerans]|uniref:Uncharacterized protein n=1 Tax=Pelagirhabdus alkalitolerans TaxID=1612202 RepID=A0A1G6IH83_9BACI|nr:SE1561 family protein [Pelagirhabdus alkalitolerans]SDC05838.1 hypothetical protein SAMN05421734_10434 [Pelagirhabdus alkalitolerans]